MADIFTRRSPGLEASLSNLYFKKIWNRLGPIDWDFMATTANVNKDPLEFPLSFYSRYYDAHSKGVNLFFQLLDDSSRPFCFPPELVIFMVLKLLQAQKKIWVLLVPAINALWVNLLKENTQATFLVAKPYDNRAFTITHPTGKEVPKLYSHAIIAAKLVF